MQFLIRPPPDRAERKSGQISESVCILTQRMQGKEICVEMRFIMKSKVKKRCKQMLTGLLALSMLCGLLPQNTVNVSAATTAKTTVSSYGRLGTVDVGSKTKSGTWWKINVGSKTAFCLSLGKTCHTGNTYQVTDTHTWNQNTGGEKHGYYAKIIRFYVNDCNRAKKAFVLGQALIWAVSEGNTSEANLKNVIKQVKANTGYFPNKTVADLYKQIFQPSGTWEAKATMWEKTGATKGYQKLITVDAESSKLPGYKTTTDHTYYRQRITVHKQDEDGKGLGGIQFTLSADNLDDLYSFNVFDRNGDTTSNADEDDNTEFEVSGSTTDGGTVAWRMTYRLEADEMAYYTDDTLAAMNAEQKKAAKEALEDDGYKQGVLNKKETTIAAQKQDAMRETFRDWVFRDRERREVLVEKYNVLFNSTRPREYDGSYLVFPGMTPDIELKDYQKNAVAHVLYGNNTLLAHCVGAGKTFEMTAAAMESKRLGLCRKSLFVVPNHLTEQWAGDFLRLYPGANILAATKKDFQPANRKKFCSRIATGDYAVIIGHSQFEKIPLSAERQTAMIERQIEEITQSIEEIKAERGERYTIKQMEKMRKNLQTRLEKLNDTSRKDDVVTFEQLGVDRLFVDESHFYKNLFLHTKMRNVAGIAQSEAQKSSDMFAKCQYLDELTGGRGITFATGTPISNSMTELYTNMRYLQYGTLQRMGLGHFDSWASSFGETQTAIELAPEGYTLVGR